MQKLIMLSMLMSGMLITATPNFKVINPAAVGEGSGGGFAEIGYNEKSLLFMFDSPDREFVMFVDELINYLEVLRKVFPDFDTKAPRAVELLNIRAQGLDVAPREVAAKGIEQALELIENTPTLPALSECARLLISWTLERYERALEGNESGKAIGKDKKAQLKKKLIRKQ